MAAYWLLFSFTRNLCEKTDLFRVALDLLDAVKKLKDSGADVKILAGNHDVRLLMGLRSLNQSHDIMVSHMFLRMGAKIVPLLHEVYKKHVVGQTSAHHYPDEKACEVFLFPCENWFEEFPKRATATMSSNAITKEVKRLRQKIPEFKAAAKAVGMSMPDLYQTAKICQQLFLAPSGRYHWFFEDMVLADTEGSFIFVHAGLDDEIANLVAAQGVEHLNALYRLQINQQIFEFYYGPVANTLRTKYRADDDFRLTENGATKLARAGIHAIVHGHQNRHHGQRIILRQDIVHFECDTTLDRHSRLKEGLSPEGFGVTLILPEGKVMGISSDYAATKCFHPKAN